MPQKSPSTTEASAARLKALGSDIASRRKTLRVSATATAEAAGVSRVTLHRIEKGEPSVTMGAWSNVIAALGLDLRLHHEVTDNPPQTIPPGWWPVRIALADYPQLKALAWHVQGSDHLNPVEAFGIYERNARHLNVSAMSTQEQALFNALQQAFGKAIPHV